jgi:hypothetical protein
MKFMMTAIMIVLASMPVFAQESSLSLQLKYSPLGTINDAEDNLDYFEDDYQPYDMNYDHTLGAKLIYDPVYLAVQHNIADLDYSTSDATLETVSMGLAGFNHERLPGLYLMGSLGIGAGQFKFDESEKDEWETLLEASAEIGFRLQERFLLGMGIDYQRFGEFGDHKANYWNLYLSTGIVF